MTDCLSWWYFDHCHWGIYFIGAQTTVTRCCTTSDIDRFSNCRNVAVCLVTWHACNITSLWCPPPSISSISHHSLSLSLCLCQCILLYVCLWCCTVCSISGAITVSLFIYSSHYGTMSHQLDILSEFFTIVFPSQCSYLITSRCHELLLVMGALTQICIRRWFSGNQSLLEMLQQTADDCHALMTCGLQCH